ncbi:MAG: DUF4364 family protein [Clostridia bacterium]|nr:DUF4364 family protein [Clostridia bacterium]
MFLDDVQIRLVILYTLKCFKISMTEGDLQEVLSWNDIIDYFTMVDFLLDMQKLGLVTTVTVEGAKRYDITKKGHETLGMFKDKIPLSIRDKIYDMAEKALSKMARGREIAADIQPIDERKFLAKCGVYEFGVPLMELSIYAGSRKHAEEIAKKFEKTSASLYKIILENIIE